MSTKANRIVATVSAAAAALFVAGGGATETSVMCEGVHTSKDHGAVTVRCKAYADSRVHA